MEGQDIRGLMEAYSQVYEAPEVLNEEVVEEDVEQLMERGAPTDPKAKAAYDAQVAKNRAALGNTLLYGNAAGRQPSKPTGREIMRRKMQSSAAKPAAPAPKPAAPAAKPAAPKPAAPAAKPAAPAAKPAASAAPKPTAPTKPAAKPAGSAMDQWAKANPKLAAAKAERDRTRGTSATTNPLMKDMKSRLPAPAVKKESVDVFDLVKGHLLDEGYAESEEGAMVIMINMSEEWRKSILESYGVELDEAQEAREKPEEHEENEKKEHEKKYGNVRGERTPMPPRGDKRREEFEKWYAKQMGR